MNLEEEYKYRSCTKKGKIAYLTLNRPAAQNAVNPETILELVAAISELQQRTQGSGCRKLNGHFALTAAPR